MHRKVIKIAKLLWETVGEITEKKIMKLSAALSYYTVFSIAPMLIVVISLFDIFFGREAIEGNIYGQINSLVGEKAALQIQEILKNASISHDISWASIVGIISLLFAATGIFTEIQDSINFIWNLKAKPKKGKGILKLLLNRLLSFSMIIGLGFVLLVSLAINAIMSSISEYLLRRFPETELYSAYLINILLTYATITVLFAIIFKILPDARIKWRDVFVGAIVTAIFFMIGKFAIGFYLGRSSVSSTYGAAGSIVIILLWVYYSAIILYFGAAFTRIYALSTGRQIYPSDYAVHIERVEMESHEAIKKTHL